MKRNPYFKEWSAAAEPQGYPDEIDPDLRPHRRGRGDRGRERPGRLDLRPAARRPARRDRHQVREPGARQHADGDVLRPDERQHRAVQQRQGPRRPSTGRSTAPPWSRSTAGATSPRPPAPSCRQASPDTSTSATTRPAAARPGPHPTSPRRSNWSRQSGTAGQTVGVVVQYDDVNKQLGEYLQSVLNQIGYKAMLKPISPNIQFTYIQNTNNKVQISISSWYQDYPAASDFLQRAAVVRLVPPGQRLEHQHRRLLRQEHRRPDGCRAQDGADEPDPGQHDVGPDRSGRDEAGPGRPALHPQAD